MSRINRNQGIPNPISHYLSFHGTKGKFNYYDSATKQAFELDEIEILLLDVKTSISGYDADNKLRISSNLVTSTAKEPLTVKAWKDGKGAVIAEGLYKDIKDLVKAGSGKYTQNLLALADLGYGEEIINLQLKSTSLGAWIEFRNKYKSVDDIYDHKLIFKPGVLCKRDEKKNVPVPQKEIDAMTKKLEKDPLAPRPVWFYVPTVGLLDKLTDKEVETANNYAELVEAYYKPKTEEPLEEVIGSPAYIIDNTEAANKDRESQEELVELTPIPF